MALRTLGGIDALIALQGIEDPVERRRRAVKHGRRALDALDELKIGLLAGTLDQATMLRLKSVAADLHDASGDDRLDQVLAEIDLRVAVELAKAGMVLRLPARPETPKVPRFLPGSVTADTAARRAPHDIMVARITEPVSTLAPRH